MAAGTATADEATVLEGPGSIAPGHTARFTGAGFPPGSNVEIVLAPGDKPNCCAIRIASSFRVGNDGGVVMRFLVPTYYKRCGAWTCSRARWRRGEKVVVTASGYLAQAKTTTIIARAKA
jgi:hypothetical protein